MKHHDDIILTTIVVGQLATNCYLVINRESHEAFIIDPGDDASYIIKQCELEHVIPKGIIATHGHFDHILGAFELEQIYAIPFYIHTNDEFLLRRMKESTQFFLGFVPENPSPIVTHRISRDDILYVGATKIEILETPGHTPGSICLYCKKQHIVVTGDTLFADGLSGRTDFSYSNSSDLKKSLQKIYSLGRGIQIFPGHGAQSTL